MSDLSVWLEGYDFPIGQFSHADENGRSVVFRYHDDWLNLPGAYPISLSLPLGPQAQLDRPAYNFFDNLLQENDQLDQLLNREGINRNDIVGILGYLGADCAGALSCLPVGAPPVKQPGHLANDYDTIDDQILTEIVSRLAKGRALPEELRDPSPVAGFRRKISLAMTLDGRLAIPKPGLGVPTTHILKIPDPNHPGEAEQEAAAARLALACGLAASNSGASSLGGQDFILIERFDRTIDETGLVMRVHQEDFAQALGLSSDLKYERRAGKGGRFDAAAIGAILDQTGAPALARDQFLRMTLFNLIIGNTDNHAKNHALLYAQGGAPLIAPMYDMVPIPLGNGFTDEFAFNIGTARRATELKQSDLIAFAALIGIPESRSLATMILLFDDLARAVETASASLTGSLARFDMLVGRELNRLADLLHVEVSFRDRPYFPEPNERGGWALS